MPNIIFLTYIILLLCQILQVFLDEVNTSSCLGLFKEIIVDKTFDGEVSALTYDLILHKNSNPETIP